MASFVPHTHALFWHLTASRKLGRNARLAFLDALAGNGTIHIPVICLAGLFYLNKKLQTPIDFSNTIQYLRSASQIQLMELNLEHVLQMDQLLLIPEMHDRLIVATAKTLGVPCLTCDQQIVASFLVPVIW